MLLGRKKVEQAMEFAFDDHYIWPLQKKKSNYTGFFFFCLMPPAGRIPYERMGALVMHEKKMTVQQGAPARGEIAAMARVVGPLRCSTPDGGASGDADSPSHSPIISAEQSPS
jgi:hypothetical protein